MSLGSSLSGISFSGLSSGIDSDSIVNRLLQIEAIPIQRLQAQQQQLNSRLGVLQQFKSRLTAFSVAAGSLNSASAFNPITATSSATGVATVTATADASAGSYELAVSKLAQAHKISSGAQASVGEPLNMSGTFVLNGKAIKVDQTDTLRTLAQKINGSSSGVTASIIDGGTGNGYITLTAGATGAVSRIQIGDLSGNIASSLGLVTGAATIREPIAGGAASFALSSASASLGSVLGLAGPQPRTFTINGESVSIDLESATLHDVAAAINSASSGATATVRTISSGGTTQYKLELTGLTSQTDDDGFLAAIGVLQRGFGNQILAAQDADYTLDGIQLTSATNTISSVIPGATITLLKANASDPEKSTLSLIRDNDGVKTRVKDLMKAYNDMMSFVKDNSKFDKESFASGPLFGDPTVRQIETTLSTMLFNTVPGLNGEFRNLSAIGFGFDSDGMLKLDEARLDKAIKENPEALGALFRSVGTASNQDIRYVSSTSKTKPSESPWDVVITQLATRATVTAGASQSGNLSLQETLTFNGSLFGGSDYELILEAGLTQEQVAAKINNDARLKELVTATIENGQLLLTSKRFGAASNFTVSSNRSGPGSTGLDSNTAVAGLDVEGTINGEEATGAGQFLTGKSGNPNTDGIQIMYTGATLGNVGTISFTKGMGAQITDLVGVFTDGVNGLLTANDNSIQAQVDNISKQIETMQERLQSKQVELRSRFLRMEQAISRMQSQQVRLAQFGQQIGQQK
jgi:flagellar hook-associated protein 2